jgi:hypothetical protein
MTSSHSPVANYMRVKPVATELRDQAIAAFLLTHADEYIDWVNSHVEDPVIKDNCLGFVAGVQSQLDKAALIASHGQKMLAITATSSGALMLQQAHDRALAEHPIYGGVLGVTSPSKDLTQA